MCVARTSRLTHSDVPQGDESGTSTPTAAPAAAAAEDLDFSDIKKKKKSSKKKANLEEFERQLDESRSKAKEDGDEEDEGPDGERTLDHLEDADLATIRSRRAEEAAREPRGRRATSPG